MDDGSFEFRARVDVIDYGRMVYKVVYVPQDVIEALALPGGGPARVHAVINELDVEGALQPSGDGRRYLLLSGRLLRQLKADVGTVVEVRGSLADADHVEVPDDVRAVLTGPAAEAFAALTPGKRRAVLVPIAAARTAATRARRVLALRQGLVDGTLQTGAPPKKKKKATPKKKMPTTTKKPKKTTPKKKTQR